MIKIYNNKIVLENNKIRKQFYLKAYQIFAVNIFKIHYEIYLVNLHNKSSNR